MNLRIPDNARAFIGLRFSGFKLRFDQREDLTGSPYQCNAGRDDFAQRYERAVDHHQVDRLEWRRETCRSELARIDSFHHYHPGITAQFPGKLSLPDVDGIYPASPVLQQAVRESSRRRAQIKGGDLLHVQAEFLERMFQFQPAAADKS